MPTEYGDIGQAPRPLAELTDVMLKLHAMKQAQGSEALAIQKALADIGLAQSHARLYDATPGMKQSELAQEMQYKNAMLEQARARAGQTGSHNLAMENLGLSRFALEQAKAEAEQVSGRPFNEATKDYEEVRGKRVPPAVPGQKTILQRAAELEAAKRGKPVPTQPTPTAPPPPPPIAIDPRDYKEFRK